MEITVKRRKTIMKIVLVGIYLVLTLSGLIFMKLGGNTGSFAMNEGNVTFSIHPISLLGFMCYICSFLLFTKIVVMFDLSYIMPICTGIVQVLTLVASKLVFKETISTYGIIGAILVIIGIIVMNWKQS